LARSRRRRDEQPSLATASAVNLLTVLAAARFAEELIMESQSGQGGAVLAKILSSILNVIVGEESAKN
jgi:hypothetical protein